MNLIRHLFLISVVLLAISCSLNKEGIKESKIYLTNYSVGEHDSINYNIFINGLLVIEAPYKNQYLSHHWDNFDVEIPKDTFDLQVMISGADYRLQKDTVMMLEEGKSLFIRYQFTPSKDKYLNPDIYRMWDQKIDLKTFADSLYENNLLDKTYLLDTLPSEKYITINTTEVVE